MLDFSAADVDVSVSVRTDKVPTGFGEMSSIVLRRVSARNEYRARVRFGPGGGVHVAVVKLTGTSTENPVGAEIQVPGLTFTPGSAYILRARVTGTNPTTLSLKVWAAGQAEPAGWNLTVTDSQAALQAPGTLGLFSYLSGSTTNAPVTFTYDDFNVVPANEAPAAAMTADCDDLTCSVNGTSSADPDGTIAAHSWSFGDGATASGATASHTYATAGTYLVTVSVTDNQGAISTTGQLVTVVANQSPAAALAVNCDNLDCAFDATTSTDADGTIASYDWDFGDTNLGTGTNPTHTYATDGTYTVTLTVTDDDGATATATDTVTVAANQAPVAALTASCDNLDCAFDAAGSTDADGTIASYDWDFGDTNLGTGANPTHTYAADGTYTVTLTVTDDDGATTTATTTATVTLGPAFNAVCQGLDCTFDADGATGPNGTAAAYDWDFGDTTTGAGETSNHLYAADGTYTVTLTVTDDAAGTTITSGDVTVAA
jgi:large repetitive protein